MKKLIKKDEEWRKILTRLQFNILREKGTEFAFRSSLYYNKEKGKYSCVACNNLLFKSEDKYESGTGWPSFTRPASKNSILYDPNPFKIMIGSEVTCMRCGGHLGHVFMMDLLFCINWEVLRFLSK